MPTTTPCLWFDGQAEQAATLYTDVFPNSAITAVTRYPGGSRGEPGSVMTVEFHLEGRPFVGLNAGPQFAFTEAVSFQIHCADEAEVDHYWSRLVDGGQPGRCGWLKDRFGLSWQVIPDGLGELLGDPDPGRAQRATAAMIAMTKLDLSAMRRAADQPD